ncbi:MAG: amidohydrolase, partial [Flavobacteriales bacterium]
LRQTYYDGCWYATSNAERNLTLEAWNSKMSLPHFFDAGEKWNILRADEIGDEFGIQYIIKTNGTEYQRIADVKKTGAALIVPLNFPDAYDVSDENTARMISLEEMKHWELAPANCAFLSEAQIPFSITAFGLEDKSKFLSYLRKAIANGLKPEDAMKALTHTPALLLGSQEIGSLRPGSWANFIVSNLPLLEYEEAIIQETWTQGAQRVFEEPLEWDPRGKYAITWNGQSSVLQVEGIPSAPKAKLMRVASRDTVSDTTWVPVQMSVLHRSVNLCWTSNDSLSSGLIRLQAMVVAGDSLWVGSDWKAAKIEQWKSQKPKVIACEMPSKDGITYPFGAFGTRVIPSESVVLFRNATVWTSDKAGKLEATDVLVSKGKIVGIGKNLDITKYPGVEVIDATGKHLTPGIIDEHSHIALASVNEGAQASSAEVKESFVIYPEDIDIYRQLSGGVTSAQLLHGSANPIGGQSAIVK